MIVAVVAEKGGVGKTVVATNLAGMRAAAGLRALLLDVDRQGSSTFWTQFRSARSLPQVEAQAHRGEAFRRYISAPRALHDDIVIDVGAGDGPSLDTALQGADCAGDTGEAHWSGYVHDAAHGLSRGRGQGAQPPTESAGVD